MFLIFILCFAPAVGRVEIIRKRPVTYDKVIEICASRYDMHQNAIKIRDGAGRKEIGIL